MSGSRSATLRADLRTIGVLALPVILETILQTLLGTTDTYFAGRLHDHAIAAIGVTGLFVNLLITVFTAVSVGITAVVARSVAGTIEGYFYIPAMGFAVAASTMVGIRLGEEDPEGARRLTWLSNVIATASMMLIAGITWFFAPRFAAFFTDTAEVQALAVRLLHLIAFFQPFAALTQIMAGALQGAGDTRFPMYSTFGGIWLLHVGIGCFLATRMGWGLFGIWCGYALDITVRGILLLVRFRRGKWQKIEI